jgi:hypothetical protein
MAAVVPQRVDALEPNALGALGIQPQVSILVIVVALAIVCTGHAKPKPKPKPEPDAPGKMAVLGKLEVDANTVPALRLARTELKLDCMEAMRLDTGPAGGCVGLILASGGRAGSSVIDFRRVLASRWLMNSTFSFDGEGGGRRRGLFGLAAVTAAVTVAATERS